LNKIVQTVTAIIMTMDPYKILEINKNATDEEIKIAYKRLAKKYHPDRYDDNPLKELAEEKLREINTAYDMLSKKNANNSDGTHYSASGRYSGSNATEFNMIRNFINNQNFPEAQSRLNQISDKSAEWYFLSGIVALNTGRQNQGINYIDTAVRMAPNNPEYQNYRNQIFQAQNSMFSGMGGIFNAGGNAPNDYVSRSGMNRQLCQCMQCYCCMDACCDCI
jgi:molecular chaperone DnaJ